MNHEAQPTKSRTAAHPRTPKARLLPSQSSPTAHPPFHHHRQGKQTCDGGNKKREKIEGPKTNQLRQGPEPKPGEGGGGGGGDDSK